MAQDGMQRTKLEEAAYAAIAGLTLPVEVLETKIREGLDFSGDPVLRVTLVVPAGELDNQTMRRIVDGIYTVQRQLLAAPLERFPLVGIEQAA